MKQKISGYKILSAAFVTALSLQVSGCSSAPIDVKGTYLADHGGVKVELNLQSNDAFMVRMIIPGEKEPYTVAGKYAFNAGEVSFTSIDQVNIGGAAAANEPPPAGKDLFGDSSLKLSGSTLKNKEWNFNKQ